MKNEVSSIKINYKINSKIYFLIAYTFTTPISMSCPVCEGNSTKSVKGGTWTCNKCNGNDFRRVITVAVGPCKDFGPCLVSRNYIELNEAGILNTIYITGETAKGEKLTTTFHEEDEGINHVTSMPNGKNIKYQAVHHTKESFDKEYKRLESLLKRRKDVVFRTYEKRNEAISASEVEKIPEEYREKY